MQVGMFRNDKFVGASPPPADDTAEEANVAQDTMVQIQSWLNAYRGTNLDQKHSNHYKLILNSNLSEFAKAIV